MRTVAIVGSHPGTKDLAPWERKHTDIWVFNEAASLGWPERVSAVFQMHAEPIWKNPLNVNDRQHYEWLKQPHDYPVYMLERHEEIPASVRYPIEMVCEELLGGFRKYFTSSVCYALALAIYQDYERIEIYGVEMETNTEYQYQRDGVTFWIGVALGRGVEVVVPEKSELLQAPLYGYEGDIELREEHLLRRLEELKPKAEQARREVERTEKVVQRLLKGMINGTSISRTGVRETRSAAKNAATGSAAGGNGFVKEYFNVIKAQAQALIDLGVLDGAVAECVRYLDKAKKMEEAAGRNLFARQEFERGVSQWRQAATDRQAKMNNVGGQATLCWNALQQGFVEKVPRERIEDAEKMYRQTHGKFLEASYEYGVAMGKLQENMVFLRTVDELIRAAGGSRALKMMAPFAPEDHRGSAVNMMETAC